MVHVISHWDHGRAGNTVAEASGVDLGIDGIEIGVIKLLILIAKYTGIF